MQKKTIVHIIDYMGRGGAEILLVKILKELHEYHNIVVTLNKENHFGAEFVCDEYYCLNMGNFRNVFFAARRFKKFLSGRKVDLVHSHLFPSNLVARLATPKRIPLVTTIHINVAIEKDFKKWYLKVLEKLSYRMHKSTIIGVSETVLNVYFKYFGLKPYRSHLLYTFVDLEEFVSGGIMSRPVHQKPFRLVAVAALRLTKNYAYLIRAFQQLKAGDFELHIYGSGVEQQRLEDLIAATGTGDRVIMKGEVRGINKLLDQYDAYVMSSTNEGFSVSVLEAMSMEMPMLLSDIDIFREQAGNTALYFDLNDIHSFISRLKELSASRDLQVRLATAARKRAVESYTLEHHMNGLRNIYTETLATN